MLFLLLIVFITYASISRAESFTANGEQDILVQRKNITSLNNYEYRNGDSYHNKSFPGHRNSGIVVDMFSDFTFS